MFVVIAILTHHHCKCQQLILSQHFLNFTNIYISILKYFLCNAPLQKLSIFQSFCISVHKLYVQVTESMTSEDVRKRELTPLQKRACEKTRVFSFVLLLIVIIIAILHKKGYSSPYPIRMIL